ncbi:MAG: heavy-metal-associated domain-containing protein [Proteobacteria bacterium]|nr:heavy-metal-associated domain-containing protein [Pseudomonadota bacterium]MCH8177131.1 heavy-metal-associated domain-containing protein [Pseudomonadota bacterium]
MSKVIQLSIPGMQCSGCVTAIEKALNSEAGVTRSEVNLETRSASVETDASLSVLIDAIKAAGFDATEIAADDKGLSA